MVTRTQVSQYIAEQLPQNRAAAIQAAAAWLVATGRQRQAGYLARDVAAALMVNGYLPARVTTARPLTPELKAIVETFLRQQTGATELELDTQIDPRVMGGLRLETPTAKLDATVQRQLAKLVEGVHV